MKDSTGRSNRGVILAIIITAVIIIALVAGYFLYKSYDTKRLDQALVTGYGMGYNQSAQDIAQGQTQTGSILVWQNNSIQAMSIQEICTGSA
jgi:cytochrome bd-type quinol oxidase subunit 1